MTESILSFYTITVNVFCVLCACLCGNIPHSHYCKRISLLFRTITFGCLYVPHFPP